MDDTTLHTFLFHCPAALRSLVLLGSWDNFSRPYSLQLDARRGRNLWKGCFTFSDIICDGALDQPTSKRDGLLKMGGTYWYYYKVDEDEECHNPSEPSTTLCPLLPGQHLNVLELPRERHNRSNSDTSGFFTRNPKDRYLTPVPPAPLRPLPSPRLGASSPQSYAMPLPSPWTPRSATHPPPEGFLSPNVIRHARSASASPNLSSTPVFPDFKVLKEKLASKRSASRNRSTSKSKELEIGSPTLISTTAEDLNLIPLRGYQPPPAATPRDASPTTTPAVSRSIPRIRKEFSPLGSHPVNPDRDSLFRVAELPAGEDLNLKRRRSHVPSTIVTSEFKLGNPGRTRANSADTRRTRHYLFSNDPWLSSPRLQLEFEASNRVVADDTPSAPVLECSVNFLGLPIDNTRPTSRHGDESSPSVRLSPADKELPALPRYLTPAPLFTCTSPSDVLHEEPLEELGEIDEIDDVVHDIEFINQFDEKSRSHFSTWSSDSMASTCPTFDNETHESPTLSSLASDCSDTDSPQRISIRYSYAEPLGDDKRTPTILQIEGDDDDNDAQTIYLSSTPPQLDDLRISTFGSDLFNLDIQHANSAPRRQAACFGLGFQYSLPEVEITSKITITNETIRTTPKVSVQRESSVSQLNQLIDDFAFLGESVNVI